MPDSPTKQQPDQAKQSIQDLRQDQAGTQGAAGTMLANVPPHALRRRRRQRHSASAAMAGPMGEEMGTADGAEPPLVSQSSPEDLAAQFPAKHVSKLDEKLFHAWDELPTEYFGAVQKAAPLKDGPNLVGPVSIRVAGVQIGQDTIVLWADRGLPTDWTWASKFPHGGTRRGRFLLWFDGRELQRLLDRPEDEKLHYARPDLDGRDFDRRNEGAKELDGDVESFVAGDMSIDKAVSKTEAVHKNELEVLVLAVAIDAASTGLSAGLEAAGAPEALLGGVRKAGRALGDFVNPAPKASANEAALAKLYEQVPALRNLKPGNKGWGGNLDGAKRLIDIFNDPHLPPETRAMYVEALRENLGEDEVELLFREMSKAATPEFLRKGPAADTATIASFGKVRRLVSLKSAAMLVTQEFLDRASQIDPTLPKMKAGKIEWQKDAPLLAEAIGSGKLPFDPNVDLRSDGLIQGPAEGSNAWFFAGNDVGNVADMQIMQRQLAISKDYMKGYVVVEIPAEIALRYGAARPTAIDLTVAPEGKLNANVGERCGRTDPQTPSQLPVREVVLPPLPVSETLANRIFVRGGN